MEDAHVLEISATAELFEQRIVGAAESQCREQRLTILVPGKRPRLAHQRPDHVPIVDGYVAVAALPLNGGHQLFSVPDLNRLGMQSQLDLLADQPRVDR